MASETFHETASRAAPLDSVVAGSSVPTETPGFSVHTVGGIFDEAFDLYKSHFATLALIVAFVFIPTQVVLHAAANLWLKPLIAQVNVANSDSVLGLQIGAIVCIIGAPQYGIPGFISLMTSFMASGPVAVAVANILVGRPLTVAAAYRRGVPVFWRLFAIWILLFLIFFLTSTTMVFTFSFVLAAVGTAILELTIGLTIVTFIVAYCVSCAVAAALFAFAPPLVALENLSVLAAVDRNVRLVHRKHFWRTCLTVTMMPIVTFGLQILILFSAANLVEALKWPAWAEFVLGTGLSSLISFFFQPYWMIFLTLLYFDTRVRQEGLDVRYLADNLPELDPLLNPIQADAGNAGPAGGMATPPPLPQRAAGPGCTLPSTAGRDTQ